MSCSIWLISLSLLTSRSIHVVTDGKISSSFYGWVAVYSCLENPMDGGAWWAAVHGVAKSRTRLSDFTFTFHFHALEKEMATHSSILAWRIPGTGEPSGLPSMGSHRVGHNWSDLAVVYSICVLSHIFIHSSLDGHLCCFCILAIENSVMMNIEVHIFFCFSIFIFFG